MGCSKGSAGKSPGNAWNTAPDVDRQTYQQVGYTNVESNECYLARAGNPGNEQADVGQPPTGKIETISIPVKCDLSVDVQLKATPGSPSTLKWEFVFPPGDSAAGQPYGAASLIFNQPPGHVGGSFDQFSVGKSFTFEVILTDTSSNTVLDRKPFTLNPVECKPGGGIKFIHPLPGSVMTSKCSTERVHPVTGVPRPHKGSDFAYAGGKLGPVLAASDGEVVFAGVQTGYGNLVIIGHKDSAGNKVCMTKYAHLSEIGVRAGQKVAAGDKIGIEGNTGIGTGAHLHFEIRGGQGQGDKVYDPALYISGTLTLSADGSSSNDPSQVPTQTTTQTNAPVVVTKQGNAASGNCNYDSTRPPEGPVDNSTIPPPPPVTGNKFDKAFQLTMTEEVGGWFNSDDSETQQGLYADAKQRKKTGWVNNPKDPGGLTKFGIAQQSHKNLDVNACTLDQAKSIYKANYWDKNLCEQLGNKASAVWFDATVQHGGSRKIFARAVGMPEESSMASMMAKATAMSESEFMDAFTTARLNYVSGLQVAKDMPGVTARPKRVRSKADAL